eukprot:CAMPEP_0197044462 /NCGR_PEP_ID=MMETSP1384-20130603/20513_1 /TAXON_ID=29189 /ORGANISM="Ammonia sp." /LENGTH=64 /DNA_ID=CAMNT_0042475921 /DNA_START=11 /DNA_END=201 /DNA_ORIENTATION=+
MISNTGMFDAAVAAFTATVSYNEMEIGSINMPSIQTTANQNTFVNVSSVLAISNVDQFRISVKS